MVLLVVLLQFMHVSAGATSCDGKDTPAGGEHLVERLNRRYDDFFRYRDHLEEREVARNRGRGERREFLDARAAKLEKARVEYIKNRRPKPDTHEEELKAEAAQKARFAKLEEARRCYVEQQRKVDHLVKRGRAIPEAKEFDLEDAYDLP